ncbi:MFS transporter [Actinotalea solisilvae]|uniref:MFS transporter n=1 Tax=Actinotalea solisilvae TaxID=2072922 RepID=UPI0018F231D9|nr:MFS transporter [Actinotalea solisilvae]
MVEATGRLPPPFGRYWAAAATSAFGTAVTAVALPVLVVQELGATPLEVGLVSAAQLVPYAVVGLLAGAYIDRWRRKPVLVAASVARALALAAIPVLWLLDALPIGVLVVALLVFGGASVFGFAATQSLLPRLVPRTRLVEANARLDQTDATAQTLGPAVGGALVGLLGAPVAIIVDAISYLVDAALVASLRVEEPRPRPRRSTLRAEIRDGLRWTYGHPTLGPLALSTHVWFLGNGAATAALSLLALRSLGFSAAAFGLLLGASGVASLVGASLAPRLGDRLGPGRVVVLARAAYPVAWLLVALAPASDVGGPLLFVALVVQGLAAGAENANEMALWQSLTPDELLGRVNATRRSVNRTVAAVGAVGAGVAVGSLGDRPTLAAVAVLFAVAAVLVALSPVRAARG